MDLDETTAHYNSTQAKATLKVIAFSARAALIVTGVVGITLTLLHSGDDGNTHAFNTGLTLLGLAGMMLLSVQFASGFLTLFRHQLAIKAEIMARIDVVLEEQENQTKVFSRIADSASDQLADQRRRFSSH